VLVIGSSKSVIYNLAVVMHIILRFCGYCNHDCCNVCKSPVSACLEYYIDVLQMTCMMLFDNVVNIGYTFHRVLLTDAVQSECIIVDAARVSWCHSYQHMS